MRETTHPRRLLLAITAVLTLGLTGAASIAPPTTNPTTAGDPQAVSATGDATTSGPLEPLGAARAVLDVWRPSDPAVDAPTFSLVQARTRPILSSEAVFEPAPVDAAGTVESPAVPETAVDPGPAADVPPAAAPAITVAAVPAAGPRISIPALGINRTVEAFPCNRAAPPDNFVYRWGCAGNNNLYLLGHAGTVFKALHDAYASGTLAVGMTATWTDANGTSRTYHVTSWRLVRPTDAAWAIAAQPVPSMTLQTCWGANSEFRLVVRLVS